VRLLSVSPGSGTAAHCHPSIEAGQPVQIPVVMCGEMAGGPHSTRLLLGPGLGEFSMHSSGLLEVKRIVRESRMDYLREAAGETMRARDTATLHTSGNL
jgi:phosphotransferase system enzyme I (PtsI)